MEETVKNTYFFCTIHLLQYRLANASIEIQRNISTELTQKPLKHEALDKDVQSSEGHKVIANHIDEGAWFVCDKVWQLIGNPVADADELQLKERLADIQVNNIAHEIK